MLTESTIVNGPPESAGTRVIGTRPYDARAVIGPARGHARPMPRPAPPPGIDFGLLLRTLRRRLLVILALTVIGAGLGLAVQRELTPRYKSEVELLLEPKRADSFGADTQFGSMYVDAAQIASVVSIIESSDLLTRVVLQEHLADLPEFGDAHRSVLRQWLAVLPFMALPPDSNTPEDRQGRALYNLERSVVVDRVGATYVLTIAATAVNPEVAQRIAGAIANAYLSDQVEQKVAVTERDSAWINDRLATVRGDLQRSEDSLDAVRRKYGLLETGSGASGATMDRQVLTELNGQMTQAETDVANLRVRYEQVQKLHAGSGSLAGLAEVESSPIIADLRSKQTENSRQLAALRATYGANYPEVRRLQDAQRLLAAQFADEVSRIAERRRSDYEAAVAREQSVRDQLARAVASAGGGGGTDGDQGHEELRKAQRMVAANQGLYDSLLTRWREVQQQQTREDPEARIISQASLPDRPSFPKRFLFPAGGAAGLMFLGLGFTLVPPLLDRRFTSVTAVEQRLGLPVLGAIPMLRRQDLGIKRRQRTIVDYTSQRPLSRFAESLRMLRAYLHIYSDGGSNIVHVTSATAGEGKSTVAATLAVSAASAGVRTVLVDADVRSSAVSAMFGLGDAEGLSDVIELGVPVRSVLRDTGSIPLAILSGGSSSMPRPDIIHSARFAALLRELSELYSLVILDGPPVLPVSDALVMSKYADATILVVQWRATPKDIAEQAAKVLRTVGAPLAGVILNKIDLSKISQYESGYPQ